MMKIALGSDHGGYVLKDQLAEWLKAEGYEVIDCGTDSLESCHYPSYAFKVAKLVQNREVTRGILLCTTGEGVMIAANKVKGIRCGLAYNDETARLMVEHNNANVISLGAKYIGLDEAKRWVEIFLGAKFLGERHAIRVKMITDYESEHDLD